MNFVACNEVEPISTEPVTESQAVTEPENTEAQTEAEPVILDKSKHYDFLFIGNSYTQYNTMPEQIFAKIIKAAGYDVTVTRITKGGWYLINSAKSTDEVGAKVDAAFAKTKFEYVVLQEQSTCPALEPGKFYDGVRQLTAKAKANGAEVVLYSTWGRKAGHSVLNTNGWTNETMTWKIAAPYEAIGKELGLDVAFAGLAFRDVYSKNNTKVNIYDNDLTHPSYAGSYLAAMTIFAKITGVDPNTVSFKGTLTEEKAAILKEAARKAVFETPEIPAQYKVTSEGVKMEAVDYSVDCSKMKNLTAFPKTALITGIKGTKNAIASKKYSTTGLSASDKADIADMGYGVSVIGIHKMSSSSKGYTTAVENLLNGLWSSSLMANFEFDSEKYNIKGEVDAKSKYTGLITVNLGSKHKIDALGFASGSLKGFPGVAEVYVSLDGVNWTIVPTACWDNVNGTALKSCGKMSADPNGSTSTVTCLFDMGDVEAQYIRIGVVVGRNDSENYYNTINTRELLIFGEKID